MQSISDKLSAGHTFTENTHLTGMVAGDATVSLGTYVLLAGMVVGDLIVEPGARVEIDGTVCGTVENKGGSVTVRGVVGKIADSGVTTTEVARGAIVGGCEK